MLPLAVVCGLGLEDHVFGLGLGATGLVHITGYHLYGTFESWVTPGASRHTQRIEACEMNRLR